jgi:hypothetical protein
LITKFRHQPETKSPEIRPVLTGNQLCCVQRAIALVLPAESSKTEQLSIETQEARSKLTTHYNICGRFY